MKAGRIGFACIGLMWVVTWAASPDKSRDVYEQYTNFRSLVSECSLTTHWDTDGSSIWFSQRNGSGPVIERMDGRSGELLPRLEASKMSAQELARYGLAPAPPVDAAEEASGISRAARFAPRLFKHQLFLAGEIDEYEVMSPDSEWLASLRDHDVWLRSTRDGRSVRLTEGGTEAHAWDFETSGSNPWSPNGQKLLASKVDRSQVFRMPRVHFLKRNEEVDFFYDQKAGAPLDKPEFFILSVLGKAPVHVDLGETTDQYFRLLGWLPNGNELLMARFSRDFKRVDVVSLDAQSGTVRSVMSESARTFVKIQHDVIFGFGDVGFTLLPSSRGFIWQSERDGWNHLYLYDWQGKLQRQLTRGNFPVRRVVGVDEDGGWVYFTASAEPRLYDVHLYRVPLRGAGKMQRLTEGDGVHEIALSPSRKVFRDTYSTVTQPPVTELRTVEGKRLGVVARADIAALKQVGWVAPEEFWAKAADGKTDLRGVLYRPFDFDPQKKYPLIEYIYGGPQQTLAPMQFCSGNSKDSAFPQALAQLGYVVAIIDGRGTPGRSKEFLDVVYGDWGDHVVADHAGVVRQLLAQRSYLDPNRVGIFGRSWGGHFAFRALAEAPDVYRAGLSIVPAFDAYAGILYEPYLDLPERNRAAYEAASIFRLAPQIKHPVMLMGGTSDSTYPDIMKMVAALTDANVPYELQLFPNQEHHTVGPAGDYQRDSVIRFFARHLGATVTAP